MFRILLERILSKIQERLEDLIDTMSIGNPESYGEYKYLAGQITSLYWIQQILKEEFDKIVKSEDEGEI